MTPVRPSPFPAAAPLAQTSQADAARVAAQKAFFEMAMGRAPAPAATSTAPAPDAGTSARVQRLPDPAAPAPARVLRPGSLLDIRV